MVKRKKFRHSEKAKKQIAAKMRIIARRRLKTRKGQQQLREAAKCAHKIIRGSKHSEETKTKMSEAHRNRMKDPKQKKQILRAMKLGNSAQWTPEKRARQREIMRERIKSCPKFFETRKKLARELRGKPLFSKEVYAMYAEQRRGKPVVRTREAMDRIIAAVRKANTGRKHSKEEKRKRAESNRGKKRSLETRQKISKALTGRKMPVGYSEYARKRRSKQVFPKSQSQLEVALASMIRELGIKSFKQNKPVKGIGLYWHQFDFVFEKKKILIEVDGCYWHGCRICGFETPKGNKDKEVEKAVKVSNWTLYRFKEHEIKRWPKQVITRLDRIFRDIRAK